MRNRLAGAAVLVLIICCLQLGAPRPALACFCALPADPAEAIRLSNVIFSGSIVGIAMPTPNTLNGVYSTAQQDLVVLGQGDSPIARGLLDIVLDNLLAVVAVIAALLIVFVLYLLRRRRRRSFRLKP